jgi:hypothetical protein
MGVREPYAVFLRHADDKSEGSLRIASVINVRIIARY